MYIRLCLVFLLSSVAGDEIEDLLSEQDVVDMSDRQIIQYLMTSVNRLEAERVKQQKRIDALEDTLLKQNEVINVLQSTLHQEQRTVKEPVGEADFSNSGLDALKNNDPGQDKPVKQGNREARQITGTPVAFSALTAKHDLSHLGANQNLVLEVTNVNTNNVYNPHHGVFTVPVPGIYVITATVLANQDREVWCDIVVNGAVKAQIYARGTDNRHDQGTQTILLHLKQGDDVTIQNNAVDDSIYGQLYTSFSGFLLYEEEPTAIIVG